MDMFKKYLEVFQNWSDVQMKAGQGWLETVQGIDKFDSKLIWEKTLDAYQASVQGTLDAEKTGFHILFEEVASVKDMPKEATGLVKNLQGMNEQFTGMQQEFVDTWFKALRQFDLPEFSTKFLKGEPVLQAVKA
jgi:hypothetical protein